MAALRWIFAHRAMWFGMTWRWQWRSHGQKLACRHLHQQGWQVRLDEKFLHRNRNNNKNKVEEKMLENLFYRESSGWPALDQYVGELRHQHQVCFLTVENPVEHIRG